MERLKRIVEKPSRLILGLMSGTSHDGVDAALVRLTGFGPSSRVELVVWATYPYPSHLRERIGEAMMGTVEEICRLNFDLGEVFAEAALRLLSEAGIAREEVDLIASHGQTLVHLPPSEGRSGATLQVGEGAVIAQRTGVVTVSDFRVRDLAAGGQGAPLVAYADYVLFHQPGQVAAVQNLGGIANVTLVPDRLEAVIAFDTGPGNALLDEAVRLLTDGREAMDRDGERAARGRADAALLDALLAHPFFVLSPPKSTGRETFGRALVESIRFDHPDLSGEDLLATLTALTVRSIAQAYEQFLLPRFHNLDRVILTGGGCRNPVLVEGIRQALSPIPVVRIDDLGIPHQAKEALSFAILANETLAGRPGNVPSATGAKETVVLGKISL